MTTSQALIAMLTSLLVGAIEGLGRRAVGAPPAGYSSATAAGTTLRRRPPIVPATVHELPIPTPMTAQIRAVEA
jgi:hypothetical protein